MYSNIIIIGTGKIACSCLDYIMDIERTKNVMVYEYMPSSLSALKSRAAHHNIEYKCFNDKNLLTELLFTIKDMTLIISANNIYLFPECICSKQIFTIINYHSALLPQYPGVNAITWTIFSGEKRGGITWHFVDSRIDHGDIIIQKTCNIEDDMTAIQLNKIYDKLATDAFKEILPSLLNNTYHSIKQPDSQQRIYRKNEIPENGQLDLTQNTKFLYRMLRSFDYGALQLLPPPIVSYNDITYCVKNYSFAYSGCEVKNITLKDMKLEIIDEAGQLVMTLFQPPL